MPRRNKRLRVAVVGATGMVGGELMSLLERRRFPVEELLPFRSGSHRAFVRFRGKLIPASGVSWTALKSADLVFLVSSDTVARRYGPALAASGIWVIDDSSAFRLDPKVPLVIPEINADQLSPRRRLIAGPNCTATGPAVAGFPLIRAAGVRTVRIASYQAVSGAGKNAMEELARQMSALDAASRQWDRLAGKARSFKAGALPKPIALNLFPQVGSFDGQGHSSEEIKVAQELRKMWGRPKLAVSATTVRVPVLRGHSVSFWLETRRPLSPKQASALLRRAPGVRLWRNSYPTPIESHGTWPVHVGRVRPGAHSKELCLWVVSDNLLKGAALNSVQIAETLLRKRWLQRRLIF